MIFAISAAAIITPVNPKTPAMMAMIKKITTHESIARLPYEGDCLTYYLIKEFLIFCKEFLNSKNGLGAQFFFNAQKLVVFCQAIRA